MAAPTIKRVNRGSSEGRGGRPSFGRLRLVVGRARLFSPRFGWAQAARLAIRDRRGASGEFSLDWPGYQAPVVLRAGGSDLLTFYQVIAENGYEMPFEIDQEPDVIVDAGANIGLASIWYSTKYPFAQVVAIEPELNNFVQLQRNVAPYRNITAICAALWPTGGAVRLSDGNAGSFAFQTLADDGAARVESDVVGNVAAISISELMREHGLSAIDILKIDIEGSEKELFEGDTSWLRSVSAIAIELHDRFKPGCREAFDDATSAFEVRETLHDETFVRRP